MGRTLATATMLIQQEEQSYSRFRRALRRSDQLALDDLFTAAKQHIAAAQYATHALPFETFLLSMLLEEHKEVMRLRTLVESLMPARKDYPLRRGPVDPGFGFDDDPKINYFEENDD